MKNLKPYLQQCLLVVTLLFSMIASATQSGDPLPSWNEGTVKQNIIQFVNQVTDKASPLYVPPQERIATFDNDGTLWVEQPLYTQGFFLLDRVKALAPRHPEWKNQKPFSFILSGDTKALYSLTVQDMEKLIAATHTGMTVEQFIQEVKVWLATAVQSRYQRHYTELIYQPMLEVMDYLRANQFKIYIVTGGGQDFVRAFSTPTYHVQSEEVIGSAIKTKYTYQGNKPVLIKIPAVFLIDDHAGKAEGINLFIGKKPIIAFGNSDGDREMLEWTQSGQGARLMLLVHHDDAKREYAYGPESKVGTFSNALMNEAKKSGWQVISMQQDWKVIFPFDKHTNKHF